MAYNLLIVEDEIIIAEDLKISLEEFGYNVVDIITEGIEAIKTVKSKKIDLVIMDIKLNGKIDGIETAKRIKNINDVPIVFVTAYTDEETVKKVEKVNPVTYLFKPFSKTELKSLLDKALLSQD